jgi:hypothetical protein
MCLVLDREKKACISDRSEMQLSVLLLVVAFLLVALALQVVALRPGGRPSAFQVAQGT